MIVYKIGTILILERYTTQILIPTINVCQESFGTKCSPIFQPFSNNSKERKEVRCNRN